MTLVVSDVSNLGIIMVGDSAVTYKSTNGESPVEAGAVKVQYSEKANVGFAMWGNADVGGQPLDSWIAEFIDTIMPCESIDEIGINMANNMNLILLKSGRPWKDLVRGIHLAGYKNGAPCLYHVHCGGPDVAPHELKLHKDFPDNQSWTQSDYDKHLKSGFIHLRNGYHVLFGPLFGQILEYSKQIRQQHNITFPMPSLQSRLDFYKLLVSFVAETLRISGLVEGVNNVLSAVGFDHSGLIIDQRLPINKSNTATDPSLCLYFREILASNNSLELTAALREILRPRSSA